MNIETKILTILFVSGLFASILSIFSGKTGGAELDDAAKILNITFVSVFLTAIILLIKNIKSLKKLISPAIFLVITFIPTFNLASLYYDRWRLERVPSMAPEYKRPVSKVQYNNDSLQVIKYIHKETQHIMPNMEGHIL